MAHWPSDVSPRVVETRLRVRYAETDQMGVVYYANYLVWMEIGRVEYCRAMGVRYREMEQEDRVLLTVVESNCRYLYPAKYDDEIIVKTWLSQAHARIVTFAYENFDWDDEIRVMLEERASYSPDALTGMEANIRFAGPETMETKIFGRLTAWQNWIFQRPNSVGEQGALKLYGTGIQPTFDRERV